MSACLQIEAAYTPLAQLSLYVDAMASHETLTPEAAVNALLEDLAQL